MAIHSTIRRNGEMAYTSDLKSDEPKGSCWFKSSLRHHIRNMVLPKLKGSRLKAHGSKVYDSQGSKRQDSKDVTRAVVGRERPAVSYVSSFNIWNFAGFLSGRNIFA